MTKEFRYVQEFLKCFPSDSSSFKSVDVRYLEKKHSNIWPEAFETGSYYCAFTSKYDILKKCNAMQFKWIRFTKRNQIKQKALYNYDLLKK